MRKERILSIGSIIQTIYNENIESANESLIQQCKESNEFYEKYRSILNPDMGRKKYPYFVQEFNKIMEMPDVKKDIIGHISSTCIDYDKEKYAMVLKVDEDLSYVNDVLLKRAKPLISHIVRTEKFVYNLLLNNKVTYLSRSCLDFVTEEFGERYVIYEVLLSLINYFITEKNVYVNKAIKVSLNIIIMLYFNEIDMIFSEERLSYNDFYNYFLKYHVHNMTFDTEKLLSICTMYRDIKDGIII